MDFENPPVITEYQPWVKQTLHGYLCENWQPQTDLGHS
jgi:hypothetical protein